MDLISQKNYLSAVLSDMEKYRKMVMDASKKRAVNKETAQIQKVKVNKEKLEEKQREALMQCVGLIQEVL